MGLPLGLMPSRPTPGQRGLSGVARDEGPPRISTALRV